MIGIIQSAWIAEMRIRAAQGGGPFIHHIGKGFYGTGSVLGQGIGYFIGRAENQGVQTVADRQLIAHIHTGAGASRLYVVNRIAGKGYYIIHIAVFNYNQRSQYFCNTGGKIRSMDIFPVEDSAGTGIHNNPALCGNGNIVRPFCRGKGRGAEGTAQKDQTEKKGCKSFHNYSP